MIPALKILTLLGGAIIGKKLLNQALRPESLQDKVALITGGSKGLGLVLAEHLIEEGSRIAICARDESELKNAKIHLEESGAKVMTYVCDVAKREEVEHLINAVIEHYGCLDIIINNAGVIQVGPMEAFNRAQYQKAMDIMYWGIVNTTFSALPHMKSRKQGHIVNITSIGGKVSVPHLLPYSAAKFAATGFSEGSAAELRKDNIYVTTIIPGLMRTGSYVNAFFQKGNRKEFKIFSMISSTPLFSLSVNRAASTIVTAIKERSPFEVIGFEARALMEINHFFPKLTNVIFSIASRLLPADYHETSLEQGRYIGPAIEAEDTK